VHPWHVPLCAEELRHGGVRICTLAGFPLGANATATKATEAALALRQGASEIDMVINLGALRAGDLKFVETDIRSVVEVCRAAGAVCKVILEATLLTDAEKRQACAAAVAARAHFVKTSTGFGPGGATVEDVRLLSELVIPAGLGVKAAGGIRTYADARRMIDAGATRLGSSAGVQIVREARGQAGEGDAAPAGS
jgi:deoxyribose-phosphate aldolase